MRLVVLFLLGVAQVRSQSLPLTGQLAQYIRLITALKYDDQCSYANDESRMSVIRDRMDSALDSSTQARRAQAFMNDVIRNEKKFCSAPELLVCSRNTSKCVCGDSTFSTIFPNATTDNNFVVEMDGQGVQRCRWAENNYCLSDDIIRAMGLGSMVNSKCRSGTTCTSKTTIEECSFTTLVRHIMLKYRYTARRSMERITEDIYRGDVCTCKADTQTNTIHSGSEEWDWRRKKRSVSVQAFDKDMVEGVETFGVGGALLKGLV